MTITEDLIQLLRAREQRGIVTYGQTLAPFNGRDPLQDLIEELLDAAQYARQWQVERERMLEAVRRAHNLLVLIDLQEASPYEESERDWVVIELRAVLAAATEKKEE